MQKLLMCIITSIVMIVAIQAAMMAINNYTGRHVCQSVVKVWGIESRTVMDYEP